MSDSSESYIFLVVLLIEKLPFNVLLYDDNVKGDRTTIGDSNFPTLPSLEMKVVALNKEEAQTFIRTYHIIFGQDPSDSEIKDHLARGTHLLVLVGSSHRIYYGLT